MVCPYYITSANGFSVERKNTIPVSNTTGEITTDIAVSLPGGFAFSIIPPQQRPAEPLNHARHWLHRQIAVTFAGVVCVTTALERIIAQ